jgi:hypothetical protein
LGVITPDCSPFENLKKSALNFPPAGKLRFHPYTPAYFVLKVNNNFVWRTCLKMIQKFDTAKDVSEYLLEKTGQAYRDNDPDAFVLCFHLPVLIQTYDGQSTITTKDGLRRVYQSVKTHYDNLGVTDLVRNCVEASFIDETTVLATHETRLLRGTLIVQRPFPTLSVLRFSDDDWKICSSIYAISDRDDHNAALLSAGKDK